MSGSCCSAPQDQQVSVQCLVSVKVNITMCCHCCGNDSSPASLYRMGSSLGISSSCWWLPPRASWALGFTVSCSVSLVLHGAVECFLLHWKWLALLYCGFKNFIQLSLTFLEELIIVYKVSRGPSIPDIPCLYKNAVSDFVIGKRKLSLCNYEGIWILVGQMMPLCTRVPRS